MVSKILFETFAAPSPEDGSYYLRPDRIKAAILLDGTSGLPSEREAAIDALNTEKANDQTVRMKLQKIENELRCNVRNNYGAVTDDDIIDTRTQGAGNEGKQRLVAQKKKSRGTIQKLLRRSKLPARKQPAMQTLEEGDKDDDDEMNEASAREGEDDEEPQRVRAKTNNDKDGARKDSRPKAVNRQSSSFEMVSGVFSTAATLLPINVDLSTVEEHEENTFLGGQVPIGTIL